VRRFEVTAIDQTHDLVRVFYHAEYEKNGKPIGIDFDLVYFMQIVDGDTTIFGFVAGDEMARYRERGWSVDNQVTAG
jgi:hypothetical protein